MDLAPVFAEALDILVRYLRIDTSNPPGNEKPAARFLGSLLESEGIECEYIETQPEREILVARLRGDGSKRPIMLCNHTDVVPVEAQYWDMPAFEGVVRDGRVYGRGAIDMKGCGVMQLMAFLLLHRNRVPLTRDVIFCAVPDEEAGSTWGMKWLSEHRPDICDVEFELSEGGGGADRFGGEDVRLFNVATNEKSICWLQLTAVGTPATAAASTTTTPSCTSCAPCCASRSGTAASPSPPIPRRTSTAWPRPGSSPRAPTCPPSKPRSAAAANCRPRS
ncbi:MAG: M20/M25/M40 family metallo-hydrolase [Thermoflexaceae bacterium]|nr:M20/M25/M40 family metallo-hydrolase [Thermoflexaceae bacterium]